MKTLEQRITELDKYLDKDQNHDIVLSIISKLQKANADACKSEYSKQELHELIFSKNDCLATSGAKELPKEMLGEIKNLQLEIVDAYGMQD
jgi:predicted transcriptional regulator